jgi:hypothetical protein
VERNLDMMKKARSRRTHVEGDYAWKVKRRDYEIHFGMLGVLLVGARYTLCCTAYGKGVGVDFGVVMMMLSINDDVNNSILFLTF